MNQELIIPRNKRKFCANAIFMILIALMVLFVSATYFLEIPGVDNPPPLPLAILFILCAIIMLAASVLAFRQAFKTTPLLVINAYGIQENINYRNTVGLIRWEDIADIDIVPAIRDTYFYCIHLKRPEKYIKNPRLLAKIKNATKKPPFGHICFPTTDIQKYMDAIIAITQHYFDLTRERAEAFSDQS